MLGPMKASEIFGVVVLTTSLIIIIYGLWDIWTGVETIFENILQMNQDSDSGGSVFSWFAFGAPAFIFGVLCFFCADWIVKITYRDS